MLQLKCVQGTLYVYYLKCVHQLLAKQGEIGTLNHKLKLPSLYEIILLPFLENCILLLYNVLVLTCIDLIS